MAELYTMTSEGLKKQEPRKMEFYTIKPNGILSTDDRFSIMEEQKKTNTIAGFDDFLETAHEISDASEDLRVMGRYLEPFIDNLGMIKLRIEGDGEGRVFDMTDWSLSQLAQKLSVPSAYAVKMAEAAKRDLFVENFKSWISSHHSAKYFFIRIHGSTVRGFLSDSYFPTDTDTILPIMRDALMKTNMNFSVHKGIINPEYTNVRIISDREIRVGDDPHFTGISLSTSDVGRAAMKIEFFIYRSACTNGMLFGKHGGELFRKKHTSRHMSDPALFENEVRKGLEDLDGMVAYAEDILKEANRYKLGTEDMNRIISEYRTYTGTGMKEMETVREMLKPYLPVYNNVDTTLWSVSNAFTEIAQLVPMDKGEQMENFAGHILHKRLA